MEVSGANLRSIQEIPVRYRSVFRDYPCFNAVQSAVLDDALGTDNSIVVSAPTGSGKTAVFEMAIIRNLITNDDSPNRNDNKIIYISPIKSLCQERYLDWHKKFTDFGVRCITATSDTDDIDIRSILQFNLIIATPEKWDVISRRYGENQKLIQNITLFMIDEVHLLNADHRGSTLEVIVSRMKTTVAWHRVYTRFVALSATIPNIADIAEWIGPVKPAKIFKFSEEVRPVKLNKIVQGYHFNQQSVFKFDMSLNYKLVSLINKYSQGKPTLIFCNTRKCVEMTASHLVQHLQIRLTPEDKHNLIQLQPQLTDGLVPENRHLVEQSFREGIIPVLVTTSTLAMGVNLPAHLVIIKNTKCYADGGYKDYDEMSIFQMIGRAGRNQFDSSATALILTSMQDRVKYEKMVNCTQTIESNLHKHLIEHLNAEVAMRTITDLDVAVRWLSSTFFYIRARNSPDKYNFPTNLSKGKLDRKLLAMCQSHLDRLVKNGMAILDGTLEVTSTAIGEIMAKYYVAFDTMKLFTEVAGSEIMIQILAIISKCKEFSEIYLRSNDKKCLNMLNKSNTKESNRFPLLGKIKTIDMKVNCIIQAVLGNLEIVDQSIQNDANKIMRSCERLVNCLIEYLETRTKVFNALLNSTILAKCFRTRLWENSPYVSKQLTGIGHSFSVALMKAGKTTFKDIISSNPRNLEMIVGRKAPFGNVLIEEATRLPQYNLELERHGDVVEVLVNLLNASSIEEKPTISLSSKMTLLVGDSDNNILLYEKYAHSYMLENPTVRRTVSVLAMGVESISAHLISDNWVGIDCSIKEDYWKKTDLPKNSRQTFLDMYMQQTKKPKIKKTIPKDIPAAPPQAKIKLTDLVKSVFKNKSHQKSVEKLDREIEEFQNDEALMDCELIDEMLDESDKKSEEVIGSETGDSQLVASLKDTFNMTGTVKSLQKKYGTGEKNKPHDNNFHPNPQPANPPPSPNTRTDFLNLPRNIALQKTIKWKSPLVENKENSEIYNRSQDSPSDQSLNTSQDLAKRKARLPLSDQDCLNDTLDTSRQLAELCDLESFGLSKRKRNNVKSTASSYYSQLMSSQREKNMQESQDLFSQRSLNATQVHEMQEMRPPMQEMRSAMKEIRPPMQETISSMQEMRPPMQEMRSALQEMRSAMKEMRPPMQEIRSSMHEMRPQKQEMRSAMKEMRPPMQETRSSMHEMRLPMQEIISPMQDMRAVEQELRSPRVRMSQIPEIRSVQEMRPPTQEMRSPTQEMRPPTQEMRPPTQEMRSPMQEIRPPMQRMRSPMQDMRPPIQEIRVPVREIRSPVPQVLDIQRSQSVASIDRPYLTQQRHPASFPPVYPDYPCTPDYISPYSCHFDSCECSRPTPPCHCRRFYDKRYLPYHVPHMRPFSRQGLNDIPESYIDQCLQQFDQTQPRNEVDGSRLNVKDVFGRTPKRQFNHDLSPEVRYGQNMEYQGYDGMSMVLSPRNGSLDHQGQQFFDERFRRSD